MVEATQVWPRHLVVTQLCHRGVDLRWLGIDFGGHQTRESVNFGSDAFGLQLAPADAVVNGLRDSLNCVIGQQLEHADVVTRSGPRTMVFFQ